jgi:hypothetical protein
MKPVAFMTGGKISEIRSLEVYEVLLQAGSGTGKEGGGGNNIKRYFSLLCWAPNPVNVWLHTVIHIAA